MKTNKIKASNDTCCCTLDLKKEFPFLKLSTFIPYYKRNLYIYNFGVHSFDNNVRRMYVWDEIEGGRSCQDLSSIISRHLGEKTIKYKKIVLYSNACGGQNSFIKMPLTLLKLISRTDITAESIDHKFVVFGHSFLPNDSEFGLIEVESRKKQSLSVPGDLKKIIMNAKKKRPKFDVIDVKNPDVVSTTALEQWITKRKKDTERACFNWVDIR